MGVVLAYPHFLELYYRLLGLAPVAHPRQLHFVELFCTTFYLFDGIISI